MHREGSAKLSLSSESPSPRSPRAKSLLTTLYEFCSLSLDNVEYSYHALKKTSFAAVFILAIYVTGILVPSTIRLIVEHYHDAWVLDFQLACVFAMFFCSMIAMGCLWLMISQRYQEKLRRHRAVSSADSHVFTAKNTSDHTSLPSFQHYGDSSKHRFSSVMHFLESRLVALHSDAAVSETVDVEESISHLSVTDSQRSELQYSSLWLNLFVVFLFLYFLFSFLHRSFMPLCGSASKQVQVTMPLLNSAICAHSQRSVLNVSANALPMLLTLCLTGLTFPTVRNELFVSGTAVMIVASIIVALILHSYGSLCELIIRTLLAIVLVHDARQRAFDSFVQHKQLIASMHAKEIAQREKYINDMRAMVANVAHDLKTPLASFIAGVEFIQQLLLNVDHPDSNKLRDSLPTPTNANSDLSSICSADTFDINQPRRTSSEYYERAFQETSSAIMECVHNIKNTTAFMLMAINRCQDYAKASKGLSLVPKYDTCELAELLSLPLECMRNIQQRIDIVMLPLNTHSAMRSSPFCSALPKLCTHFITDRQWLQENVLCLLSNAVKYSGSGKVTVAVFLSKESDCLMLSEHKASRSVRQSIGSSLLVRRNFDRGSEYHKMQSGISLDGDNRMHSTLLQRAMTLFFPSNRVVGDSDSNQSSLRLSSGRSSIVPGSRRTSHNQSTLDRLQADESRLLFLRFEVEDQGVGMSQDAMRDLFSPFKQTQQLAGGTGLGLYSLAKRLEALGGRYGVSKRRDGQQGSLFWFAIPYRPDENAAQLVDNYNHDRIDKEYAAYKLAPIKEPRHSFVGSGANSTNVLDTDATVDHPDKLSGIGSGANSGKKHLRILFVDDSPAIVKLTTAMLRRMGHNVTTAENGLVAVERVTKLWEEKNEQFDLVLMDLQMPVMDGLEATKRMRAFEDYASSVAFKTRLEDFSFKHQLIVGLSANNDSDTADAAMDAGTDAFLAKPFNIDSFRRMLTRFDLAS